MKSKTKLSVLLIALVGLMAVAGAGIAVAENDWDETQSGNQTTLSVLQGVENHTETYNVTANVTGLSTDADGSHEILIASKVNPGNISGSSVTVPVNTTGGSVGWLYNSSHDLYYANYSIDSTGTTVDINVTNGAVFNTSDTNDTTFVTDSTVNETRAVATITGDDVGPANLSEFSSANNSLSYEIIDHPLTKTETFSTGLGDVTVDGSNLTVPTDNQSVTVNYDLELTFDSDYNGSNATLYVAVNNTFGTPTVNSSNDNINEEGTSTALGLGGDYTVQEFDVVNASNSSTVEIDIDANDPTIGKNVSDALQTRVHYDADVVGTTEEMGSWYDVEYSQNATAGATFSVLPIPSIFTDFFGAGFGGAAFYLVAIMGIISTVLVAYRLTQMEVFSTGLGKAAGYGGLAAAGLFAIFGLPETTVSWGVVAWSLLMTLLAIYLYTRPASVSQGGDGGDGEGPIYLD